MQETNGSWMGVVLIDMAALVLDQFNSSVIHEDTRRHTKKKAMGAEMSFGGSALHCFGLYFAARRFRLLAQRRRLCPQPRLGPCRKVPHPIGNRLNRGCVLNQLRR